MADTEQLARLRRSVPGWNRWRVKHPKKRIDLSGSDLSLADLIGADLRKAVLNRAALVGTYLIGADLRGSELNLADLRGADLRDADLRGADLTRTLFLIQAQVETVVGDAATKLPRALTRPEHWPG